LQSQSLYGEQIPKGFDAPPHIKTLFRYGTGIAARLDKDPVIA
jgi:hypothetical protein